MNPRTLLAYIIAGLTATVIGVLLAWTVLPRNGDIPDAGSTLVLKQPRDLAISDVLNHRNEAFNNNSLEGQWSIIFFGFTHCPDICPNTLHQLQLATAKIKEPPTVYMVSVDPKRDALPNLSEYITSFNPEFIALRAEEASLRPFARSMGAAYMRSEPNEQGNYEVQHTAAVFVVNPNGKLAGYVNAPHTVDSLINAFNTIKKAYN